MTQAPTIPLRPANYGVPRNDTLGRLAALQTASTADLKRQWRELFGKEPPAFSRTYLQSRLTYQVQALAHGALRAETIARLVAIGERLDGGKVTLRRIRADERPIAGTRLIREHGGVEHVVTVLRDAFEYRGRTFRSLSAVAREITGTRWNGWTFFGLRGHGAA
jgi:hypothetical protein